MPAEKVSFRALRHPKPTFSGPCVRAVTRLEIEWSPSDRRETCVSQQQLSKLPRELSLKIREVAIALEDVIGMEAS